MPNEPPSDFRAVKLPNEQNKAPRDFRVEAPTPKEAINLAEKGELKEALEEFSKLSEDTDIKITEEELANPSRSTNRVKFDSQTASPNHMLLIILIQFEITNC